MYDVLGQAHDYAISFLDSLPARHVTPTASIDELRGALGVPLTDDGESAASVLAELVGKSEPGLMANAGGRFFGFVIGGALPVSVAADWMTSVWDQNPGIYALSPAEAVVEEVAIRWLVELLGLPASVSAGFVTGAQMANFTGLAAGRYEQLRRVGWDVNLDGLYGAPPLNIVVGEEVHVTVLRALRYLGIGTRRVRTVPADSQGRLRSSELERVLEKLEGPTIVCAQAGNVHSGAIDPMKEIATIAHEHGAWVHVDGAFGLWASAVPSMRALLEGIELADSWATDGHKWLNVPQDCGMVFVADAAAHKAAVSTDAAYLIKAAGAERDSVDFVPEFSRRGRGFPVYAALRHLGKNGVAALVQRCCAHARSIAATIDAHPNAQVLNDVVLNQVIVEFRAPGRDADELTPAVIRRIQKDGTCWLGGSVWRGRAVMRISVSNWSTTEEDVQRSVTAILRCLDEELAASPVLSGSPDRVENDQSSR